MAGSSRTEAIRLFDFQNEIRAMALMKPSRQRLMSTHGGIGKRPISIVTIVNLARPTRKHQASWALIDDMLQKASRPLWRGKA